MLRSPCGVVLDVKSVRRMGNFVLIKIVSHAHDHTESSKILGVHFVLPSTRLGTLQMGEFFEHDKMGICPGVEYQSWSL